MHSHQLLLWLLKGQYNVKETSGDKPADVSIKPSKEIPSVSLENASDQDVGYEGRTSNPTCSKIHRIL